MPAALVYQLPRGGHSERRASGAGSGEQPANDLQALPRTGAACGCQDVVLNRSGEAGRRGSIAATESGVNLVVNKNWEKSLCISGGAL